MIVIKSKQDIEVMKQAGRIAANALKKAGETLKPGITTKEVDKIVYEYIKGQGAVPSFLNYGGFPASCCISVNETVIHGIPSDRIICDGDIVSIDVGACYKGFHGDCAETFAIGNISDEAKQLIKVTRESFYKGIEKAVVGNRVSDISNAVQTYCEQFGYGVVDCFTGHGIGAQLHEDPPVPNYGRPGRGPRLMAGMTLAIEPMVNAGTHQVSVLSDKWTVVTNDKRLSAHYENTVLITKTGPVILTTAD
jgi:methionyl aminopeptidase